MWLILIIIQATPFLLLYHKQNIGLGKQFRGAQIMFICPYDVDSIQIYKLIIRKLIENFIIKLCIVWRLCS